MVKNKFATSWWTVDEVIELADELGFIISTGDATQLLRREEDRIMTAMADGGSRVIEEALLR